MDLSASPASVIPDDGEEWYTLTPLGEAYLKGHDALARENTVLWELFEAEDLDADTCSEASWARYTKAFNAVRALKGLSPRFTSVTAGG